MMMEEEQSRVTECAKVGGYAAGIMQYTTAYCADVFKKYMNQGSVLELGPAEGIMTDLLYSSFLDYTVVDGADFFIQDLKQRYPAIEGYVSLFEEYEPQKHYDKIILGHVLEHVKEPYDILMKCMNWLNKNGRILASVPNANSIHRQAAVKMGLLDYEKQLNEADKKCGHRRVYDNKAFQDEFINTGFNIIQQGGYWLKPLSNSQIETSWTSDMINAFLVLGEKYPEIAGEIYIIAGK